MMLSLRHAADAEDRAEVEVLYAKLDKSRALEKKIQASLKRLEISGKTVQDSVGPIYGKTQNLQIMNTNVDRINEAIDRIREPLDIRSREDKVIRAGPNKAGLSEFLDSLKRTQRALSELKSTNLRSNQQAISELKGLLNYGSQQLENLFRDFLREDVQPVEPLHYLTKQLPFPSLPGDKISKLGLINSYVASSAASTFDYNTRDTPTAQIYAEIRGPYIANTLKNLAAASVNTAKKRPIDSLYRQGTNGIDSYASAVEGLFLAEYDIVCSLFSREEWGRVFTATCQPALNDFNRSLGELNAHIRNHHTTDCFLGYEVIAVVTNLSFMIDSRTGELKNAFSDALKPVRSTAKASLSQLLDEVRQRIHNSQALPHDGSVIQVTIDSMKRLQAMTAYLAPLSSIMTSLGDGGWSAPQSNSSSTLALKNFDVGADGRQLFAHYASDTIDALLQSLESKGRTLLKGKSLLGVFLANNVAVIDQMIRSSDLAPLMASSTGKIEGWRKKAVSLYLDGWREPSSFLLDVQYTNRGNRPTSNSNAVNSAEVVRGLGSKEKDAIKEKFKNFNLSFDEMVARHKSLSMEKEVRPMLAREVQAILEPLYGRFWDRYHEIDKGKGKYVKYDKSALAASLASLG